MVIKNREVVDLAFEVVQIFALSVVINRKSFAPQFGNQEWILIVDNYNPRRLNQTLPCQSLVKRLQSGLLLKP
ncbi:MAG: hypothetical protein RL514_2433 [Verrucomicrobiota bacterium]